MNASAYVWATTGRPSKSKFYSDYNDILIYHLCTAEFIMLSYR